MALLVATANVPHRLMNKGLPRDMQRLADMGVVMIGTQESTDADGKTLAPRGWEWFRPDEARHGIVLWDPRKVEAKRKGAELISIAHSGTEVRYIVWVHFKTPIGPVRFGTTHLPAFYTSKPANKREYDHQEPLAAKWLAGGNNRVLVGDFNGKIPGSRTKTLAKVGSWSKQVPSGPHNAKIDFVGVKKGGRYKVTSTKMVDGGSDHKYVVVGLEKR